MSSFNLTLSFGPSDKDFINSISKEDWKNLRDEAYTNHPHQCIGCGYVPENLIELDTHIDDCIMGDKNSAIIRLLCRACHAIKHFDIAAENGWVTLVNSAHSQEKLVEICRIGRHALMAEIDANNIIVLKNTDVRKYASELKSGKVRHTDKIKVVFGKNFDWTPKKAQNGHTEIVPSEGEVV
jgi:hypothetical protein